MLRSNQSYVDAVRIIESKYAKPNWLTPPSEKMRRFLEYYNEVKSKKLPAGATVLDFGCGIGQEVAWLADQGYSAQGVDIIEYWGKDGSLWGETQSNSRKDLMDRLHLVDAADNILPFPDATFELIVSNQTLEHVFDYQPVFIEQARVLKPGGLAIHRFPHGHGLIEPHTKVPLTYLNKYDVYLKLWAALGLRNPRQKNLSRAETVLSNKELLSSTNYQPKTHILAAAKGLDVHAYFLDNLSVDTGRAGQTYQLVKKLGFGPLVKNLLLAVQDNHVLVLERL